MSAADTPLHSADLLVLLRALHPAACNGVATVIVKLCEQNKLAQRELHLSRSLGARGLCGHQLAPDIVQDLSALGRHETGPTPDYRSMLRGIAYRHGIEDDGEHPPASIERKLLRHYRPALRPDPATFVDRGSDAWWHRAAYAVPGWGWVAYLLSPDWKVVTAAVLEIAAQRRIALTRASRAMVES